MYLAESRSSFCPLQVSILGLEATSQATKQFACLSGGTPLALAAFVGDEAGPNDPNDGFRWLSMALSYLCPWVEESSLQELIKLLWQFGATDGANDIGVRPKDKL